MNDTEHFFLSGLLFIAGLILGYFKCLYDNKKLNIKILDKNPSDKKQPSKKFGIFSDPRGDSYEP